MHKFDQTIPIENYKNGPPDNYRIIPKKFPQLFRYIRGMTWDYSSNTIDLTVLETPNIEVVRWLKDLTEQKINSTKSPFCDTLLNSLEIIINTDEVPISVIILTNLELKKHELTLGDVGGPFWHKISLTYQSHEFYIKAHKMNGSYEICEWEKI